jgi:uncharacterized protein (TIRG00374 family)
MNKHIIKISTFILKLALAFGIIWYLLLRNPDKILSCLKDFNLFYLLLAAICYGSHIVFCAIRWRQLAQMIDIKLSYIEAISLTFQGNFFSLVIPGGAIGGDVVKMSVITKRSQAGTKMEGAFTVLMDRIIGMIALFVLALILVAFGYPLLLNISIPNIPLTMGAKQLLLLGLITLCISGLLASCVIFFHRLFRKVKLFDKLINLANQFSNNKVDRLILSTDTYASKWPQLTYLTITSILFVHIMTVIPFGFLLTGLNIKFSLIALLLAIIVGNIAGLIPLFPGGLGARDLAIVTILASSGINPEDAKAAQVVYTSLVILFALSGGIFFVFDKGRKNPNNDNIKNSPTLES